MYRTYYIMFETVTLPESLRPYSHRAPSILRRDNAFVAGCSALSMGHHARRTEEES